MLGFGALSEFPLSDAGSDAASSVTGTGAATLDFAASAAGEYQSSSVTGTASATLAVTAEASGGHGVAGAGTATVDIAAAASSGHGVAGTDSDTLSFAVAAAGAHGVAAAGSSTLTLAPAVVATHERYEVRGEVRQGGVLVNRKVRVYLRSTGVFVNEADTVVGKFNVHTGFAPAEHYIVPIHLDDAATDWMPPTSNRVVSVLAQDA